MDLLKDLALEDGLVLHSGGPKAYRSCNLLTGADPEGMETLWVADGACRPGPSDGTGKGGVLFICSEAAEDTERLPGRFPDCETAVLVSADPAPVVFSRLQSAAIQRTEPLLEEADFAESLFSRRSITQVVDQATAVLKSPVILTSSSYKVLAMNDGGLKFDDPVWNAALETGYCSAESVMHFEKEGITRQVWQTQEAFLLHTGLAEKIPRILQKVEVFGRVGAYIGVFQVGKTLTEKDCRTVDLICRVLSVMLEKDEKVLQYTTEISQSILLDLLSGRIASSVLLKDRMRSALWNVRENFRCAVLLPDDPSKGIPNADYLLAALSSRIPSSRTVRAEDGLVVLLNFSAAGTREPYDGVLAETAEKYGLSVGVSNEFRDLLKLSAYYATAMEAIRITRALHTKRRVSYFCDVIFYAVADQVESSRRAAYQQSKYKLLADYDRKNDAEYCRTLMTYIECGCSSTLAAGRLFLHRNTMTHRLEKIEEITGLDLKDGQELLHFFLSDRIAQWDRTVRENSAGESENTGASV